MIKLLYVLMKLYVKKFYWQRCPDKYNPEWKEYCPICKAYECLDYLFQIDDNPS